MQESDLDIDIEMFMYLKGSELISVVGCICGCRGYTNDILVATYIEHKVTFLCSKAISVKLSQLLNTPALAQTWHWRLGKQNFCTQL